jgi:uncharacterized protein (TIGR04255 family)
MSSSRQYPKAPITEAAIDFQVRPAPGIKMGNIASCCDEEEENYPTRKELKIGLGHFEVGPRISASASSQQVGFVCTSADEKQVFQAQLNGFAFSRLAPYESWTRFCAEARRLWQSYRKCLKPTAVTRLAVRYINRLDLPGERIEIKDFLLTAPEIASGLPQSLTGFFMQLQLPVENLGCTLLLNETIVEPVKPGTVSIVLDIDLFRTENLPQDEESIWSLFEHLRVKKNDIFEACITNRARELFV